MPDPDEAHQPILAAAVCDADGKFQLSWRVHLLPYLGYGDLYRRFHLDEPWNSPHNRQLIAEMPTVYACPSANLPGRGWTTYRSPLDGKVDCLECDGLPSCKPRKGQSHTALLVEVDDDQAVIWTKPDDWTVDEVHPHRGLFGHHGGGTHVLFADGRVRFLSRNIDPAVLKTLLAEANAACREACGCDC